MNVVAKKILVVDDDVPIREALTQLLTLEGYVVLTAGNGQEGLDILRSSRPDLILLDLRMPIMDGWEFKEAKDADPTFASIPVFVFSAQPGLRPPNISADGFISKPF